MNTQTGNPRINDRQRSHVLRFLVIAVCSTAIFWLTWSAVAQDNKPKDQADQKKGPIQLTMRSKLEAAAKVLEGLAMEDKAGVLEGTKVLHEVTKAEVWKVLTDSDYREHTQAFRSSVLRLEEAVNADEYASAQLEWLEVNKKCFDCHNHIRRERANRRKQ